MGNFVSLLSRKCHPFASLFYHLMFAVLSRNQPTILNYFRYPPYSSKYLLLWVIVVAVFSRTSIFDGSSYTRYFISSSWLFNWSHPLNYFVTDSQQTSTRYHRIIFLLRFSGRSAATSHAFMLKNYRLLMSVLHCMTCDGCILRTERKEVKYRVCLPY